LFQGTHVTIEFPFVRRTLEESKEINIGGGRIDCLDKELLLSDFLNKDLDSLQTIDDEFKLEEEDLIPLKI